MISSALIVDAHAHLYENFDLERGLAAAFENFGRARAKLSIDGAAHGCLLCADLQNTTFEAVLARVRATSRFQLLEPDGGEPCTRLVHDRQSGASLSLVEGVQVITDENIEVLVFGPATPFMPGRPLRDTLARAHDAGALTILPWGFGKWSGSRGSAVRAVLDDPLLRRGVFVGDNGGRPRLSPRPSLLVRAGTLGVHDLPGSDPLPFPEQALRLGSSGFVISGGALDPSRPVAALLEHFGGETASPTTFRQGSTLPHFVRNQFRMQLRKPTVRRRV